jgi:hypothetical protein
MRGMHEMCEIPEMCEILAMYEARERVAGALEWV